jgi:SAM-dependent methyltransferase
MRPDDPWSRVDYRRLIAWPQRIEREWPFLSERLESGPSRRVLDLGSGTGEHSRYMAAHGFDVTGIDQSPAMLARAREEPLSPNLRFIEGDITDVASLVDVPAGGAICLGNTLPHLDDAALSRLARGLAVALAPGAPFVFQVLNYERIRARGIRNLPLNFRKDDDRTETVFVRLIEPVDERTVIFTPTTLRYAPAEEPPVSVITARSTRLRAWTWPELRDTFHQAGFQRVDVVGGFDGSAYEPHDSSDVLGIAVR